MTELLRRLTAVPSRQHCSIHIPDDSYDRQIRELISYLKKSSSITSIPDVIEYLDNIDPSIHTLSFLYLLHFQILSLQNATKKDLLDDIQPGGKLWAYSVKLLKNFDPIQVRYAGQEWRHLIELVGRAAVAASKPLLAIKLIRDSLIRLDSSSGIFTSVHLLFVRLSLLSRAHTYALPILDKVLCHFPPDTEQVHQANLDTFLCSENDGTVVFITDSSGFSAKLLYRDHLQYFLYCAMIYMALKKWNQALHCLNIVISCPTSGPVSKIMVEAYKKWLLVNLLGYGKPGLAPKMITAHVMRVYKSLTRPYMSLVDAFEQGNLQRMQAEIELGQSIWHIDNNTGLVSQLFDAFDKCIILKLGRIFSALTMADVERRASANLNPSCGMEEFVASLVMSKALRATLSHSFVAKSSALLRFSLTTSDGFQEKYVRARLARGSHALNTICDRIRNSNDSLEFCSENFQYLARSQKWASNTGKSGSMAINEAAGVSLDLDEDLMGDS